MSDMCTDNPYTSYSSAHEYFRGKDDGRVECKDEMREIIESMAYEIAKHRNPQFYTHSYDEIASIMREFGWKE